MLPRFRWVDFRCFLDSFSGLKHLLLDARISHRAADFIDGIDDLRLDSKQGKCSGRQRGQVVWRPKASFPSLSF